MQNTHFFQVLIIDDSSDDAFSLERAIKREGITCQSQRVESGEQLQQALEAQPWDVILCDVRMPELSVHKAIQIIDHYSTTPVSIVIVSGAVDIDEISHFIRGGVRDFIRKDDLSKLGDVLRREMGYVEARREQESEHTRFVEAQKMEAVGTLAGGLAHDFNNIITALMAMQWQIKEQYSDQPNLIETIGKMDQLCERASNTVKQLLGFARKGIVNMQDVNIGNFIEDNMSLFRLSLPDTITLHWQKPSQNLYIHADVTQLQQILLNLINNARDAVAGVANPCIAIVINEDPAPLPQEATTHDQQWLAIEVMDNGCGISHTAKQHLFEPFYTTKACNQGTGLGLAMAYGSMMTHHGFIDCETDRCQFISNDCDGCSKEPTCMRLLFPVLPAAEVSDDASEEAPISNTMDQMCVLFADDEEIIRDVFCAIFEDGGSQVDAFENGLLAWEQFQQSPDHYTVAVMDVSMPKMTGPEVARKIRAVSSMPIILISGYDVQTTLNLVEDVENIHVLVKPFHPDTIFNEIQKLTGEQS